VLQRQADSGRNAPNRRLFIPDDLGKRRKKNKALEELVKKGA